MKKGRSGCFTYTEKEMADAFVIFLKSRRGIPGVGQFQGIFREVSCHQGRPDFIALRNGERHQAVRRHTSVGLVESQILHFLNPNTPRTLRYIMDRSRYTEASVKRSLRKLEGTGYVWRTEKGTYRLVEKVGGTQVELWSFELKLDNPKRAVFQAQQSRLYADRAIIVVPPGQEGNYDRYTETMKRWGIGLATFDAKSGNFKFARRGRKSHPLNRQYQLYTMARLHVYAC